MDHDVPTIGLDRPIADPLAAAADRPAAPELRRARHHAARPRQHRAGHRARHRPAARPHPAGHDRRLRRQPHLDARRVRRAGLRHRHQPRSSTCWPPRRCGRSSPPPWRSPWRAQLGDGITAKDLVLGIIRALGPGGGVGSVIEYRGDGDPRAVHGRPDDGLQHVHRGRRPGRADRARTTPRSRYLEGRRHSPRGKDWESALDDWRSLVTDDGAEFDHELRIDAAALRPGGHLGHEPGPVGLDRRQGAGPASFATPAQQQAAQRALTYMGLEPGHRDPRHHRGRGVHRLVHQRPARGPAGGRRGAARPARSAPASGPWSCPARRGSRRRPRRRAWTGSSPSAGFEWRSAGLLDVPGHERGHPGPWRALAPPPATGTSRAARDPAAAPISCRPRWRRQPPSPATSPCQETCNARGSSASPDARSPSTATTSTPTRSSRRPGSSGSSAPVSAPACSAPGARIPEFALNRPGAAGARVLVAG